MLGVNCYKVLTLNTTQCWVIIRNYQNCNLTLLMDGPGFRRGNTILIYDRCHIGKSLDESFSWWISVCWMVVCKSVLSFSLSGRVFVNTGVNNLPRSKQSIVRQLKWKHSSQCQCHPICLPNMDLDLSFCYLRNSSKTPANKRQQCGL